MGMNGGFDPPDRGFCEIPEVEKKKASKYKCNHCFAVIEFRWGRQAFCHTAKQLDSLDDFRESNKNFEKCRRCNVGFLRRTNEDNQSRG